MFCKNCGKEIDDNAVVCPHCGVAVRDLNQVAPKQETNTLAIVGFILSFFFAIIGLIVSILGKKKADELNGSGKGFAIAGIVISAIEIVIYIIAIIMAVGMVGAAAGAVA